MNARTRKPSNLIQTVNAAAIAEHKNDKEYTTTAAKHSGDFILWAWGVKAGRVSATRLTMYLNDTDLECFRNKLHQSCITQPWNNIPGGLPPLPAGDQTNTAVLGLLNAIIARQLTNKKCRTTYSPSSLTT
jgi:hypothetical protein